MRFIFSLILLLLCSPSALAQEVMASDVAALANKLAALEVRVAALETATIRTPVVITKAPVRQAVANLVAPPYIEPMVSGPPMVLDCSGGTCRFVQQAAMATKQQEVAKERTGWYLGKNLGR